MRVFLYTFFLLFFLSCVKEKQPMELTGNITQVNESDPQIVEFKNTIGDINSERISTGYYMIYLPVYANVNQVWVSINNQSLGGSDQPTIRTNGIGKILIESYYNGEHSDNMLINNPFEVKIYSN